MHSMTGTVLSETDLLHTKNNIIQFTKSQGQFIRDEPTIKQFKADNNFIV